MRSFNYYVHEFGTMYSPRHVKRKQPTKMGPEWNEALEAYWRRFFDTWKMMQNATILAETDKRNTSDDPDSMAKDFSDLYAEITRDEERRMAERCSSMLPVHM